MEARPTPDALWTEAQALRVLRPAAVVCRRVRRRVGGRWLLDGFSLSVPPGARLLIVSEPHESASLLLRIVAGLARSQGGEVERAGTVDANGAWARRMAYVGPQPGVYRWMTPRQVLRLGGRLLGFRGDDLERAVRRAAGQAGIGELDLDRQNSTGRLPLLQRVDFAAALIADPEVLLLDEPLRALDPEDRSRLLRLPGDRRTVLLASRYPASEAGLCSHVAYLRNGRLAMLAPMRRLDEEGLPLSLRGIEELARRRPPPR